MRPESLEAGEFYPHQWCHGGAGMAMARQHAASIRGTRGLLDLAAIGRDESMTRDVPNDDSLCHGSLGNWLTTSGWTDGASTSVRGELKSRLLARIAGRGFLNGLPSGIRSVPGLMLGTAGALYATCVGEMPSLPNVLLLEGPERFALKRPSRGGA